MSCYINTTPAIYWTSTTGTKTPIINTTTTSTTTSPFYYYKNMPIGTTDMPKQYLIDWLKKHKISQKEPEISEDDILKLIGSDS